MNQERRKRPARRRRQPLQEAAPFLGLPYSRTQYWVLLLGVLLVGVGFALLYTGDAVFSTLSLVLGYVVLVPVALWPWKRRAGSSGTAKT